MAVRKNQAKLTKAERRDFVEALLELKRRGGYDKYVEIHDRFVMSDLDDQERTGHVSPSFLPWHRQFLLDFERDLQSVNPAVTLPYWDFTVNRSLSDPVFAPDFLGGNGRERDAQVMDGPFAYSGGRWPIYFKADERPFLMREMGRSTSTPQLPTAATVEAALAAPYYDEAPWNSTSKAGFRNLVEGWANGNTGPHNTVHRWVGGHMNTGMSPNDPVFWLLHCFIDKLWSDWQRRHPKAPAYLPVEPVKDIVALDEPMKPWSEKGQRVTPADMIDHRKFYAYDTDAA
ncbi:tyrosinase family protein [Streptomyces telluris]|uniref:Tyrosinase family protein n=1 Tax=Streptomyces telluris TaxID=2720021 RepID=A0A9X2LCT7_9ACTN|nr:tyrosinase family protein [Streptomyces telluris]MCQ8768820.1 tyrosinase family protein [Streptomyces telluris]NJP80290.1 tyrosinase family protein [Streptomyces telluris]